MWENSKKDVLGEVQITVLVLSHQQSKVQRYSVYDHVRHRKAANLIFFWTTNQSIEGLRIEGVCDIGQYNSNWLDLTNHFSSTYVRHHHCVMFLKSMQRLSTTYITTFVKKKNLKKLKKTTNADVLSGCSWEWLTLGASGGGVWLLLSRLSFSVLFPFSVSLAGMVWRVGSDPDSCIWTSLTWERKWV